MKEVIHPVLEKLSLEDLESYVTKNQWNFKMKVSTKLGSKHLELHGDETHLILNGRCDQSQV